MFNKDKKKAVFICSDYTVRMEKDGDFERYYLKFHSQDDSPELEITLDVFKLYYKDFKFILEKNRDEHRRHIEDGDIDDFITSGKLTVKQFENECVDKADLDAVLKTCTPVQQRRFNLHYIQGYSFSEIGKMECCKKAAVSESINAVMKKIKKYF